MAFTLEDFKNKYGYKGQVQLAPVQKTYDYYEAFGDPDDPTHETSMLDIQSTPQWRTNQQVAESYEWQKKATENEQIRAEAPNYLDNMTPAELVNYFNKPIIGSSAPEYYTNNNNPQTLDQKLAYLANQANAAIADTYGGIAGFLHADDTAKYLQDYSEKRRDKNPVELNGDFDNLGDYLSIKGFGHDAANLGGSIVALAPVGAIGGELGIASRGLEALASKSPMLARALSLGEKGISKLPKGMQDKLKWGADYATMKAVPESMSEGGQVRLDLLQNNPNNINPTMASIEAAALNYPLLVASDMVEGATIGKGAFNIPQRLMPGLLGRTTAGRVVTAPVRALPNMAFNGLSESTQEALQEAISAGAKGEEYGVLPWNWTDEQGKAFRSTLLPAALLGLAGGSAHGIRQSDNINEPVQTNTPIGTEAVLAGVEPFLGVRMDNGANGCVEAVTKIGAQMGSPFLTEQLNNGVLYVPTLVKNAGDRVIPFDPNQLEAGDLIVYGDNDHVVMYDGNGGYVGNSSSQQKVVHGGDYTAMGSLQPTKIIKNDGNGGAIAPAHNMSAAEALGQLDDESAVSLMDDFLSDAVVNGQMSKEALAALLDDNGSFINTPENRQAVLDENEQLFRAYLEGIVKSSDEEIARKVASEIEKTGNVNTLNTVQQAIQNKDGETLELIANGAKMQANRLLNTIRTQKASKPGTQQAPVNTNQIDFISNAANKDKATKNFYKDFLHDRLESSTDVDEINRLSSMLNTAGKFHNTAENRQTLAKEYPQEIADYYTNIYGPRHEAKAQTKQAQQETVPENVPAQQSSVQPVQLPVIQNNVPVSQQNQIQANRNTQSNSNDQQAQVNYQAMGMRLLDFMTEHNVPHNHDNIMRALNSDNDETMAGAVRWMYRELSNSGMDIDELNNELISSSQTTPLLGGGISNETESKNSSTKTTTATEGENTTNQVQDTESEQTEKKGEVESDNYHGYLDDKTEAQKKVIRQQLEKKTNPFGNAAGLLSMKHIMERWAETDNENKSSKEGRFYFIHGHQVKEPVYNYYNYLRDNVYGKNEEAVKENLIPPTANETEADTNVGGKTEPQGSHFETGTFTHTKTGKELPEAKFKNREERSDFLKCKKLAKQYAGWYSKYSKSFLFETEAGRDAFIKAANEDVFGQEPQEAPASNAPKETPKQEKAETTTGKAEIVIDKNGIHAVPADSEALFKQINAELDNISDSLNDMSVEELEKQVNEAIKPYIEKYGKNGRRTSTLEAMAQNIINAKTDQEKTETAPAEKNVKGPAKSKRDFIRDHVIVGTVPSEKASEKKTETESVFGDKAENDAAMLEALGINPDELSDEKILEAPEGIVNTAEERARLEKELMAELNKLSANPVFNPKIYSLGLQIGMTYVKDGINTAKKLVTKLKATFGDKIGPWAPAIAETISTWPKGVPFNEKAVMAISRAVGSRFEEGITSLDEIQDSMKKVFKNRHKEFAPMIEASYNGIKEYFDMKEGENNGNAGTKDAGMVRDTLQGHSEEPESTGTEAGGELEVPASGRISEGGNEGETVSGLTPTQEADAKASEIPGHNFTIDVDKTSTVKPQTRADRNIKAIRLVRELKNDNRKATPQEQATLADYTGWGGLIDAFTYKEGWENQREAINALVSEGIITEHEKEKMDKTTKDAYYTSPKIVAEIWKAIRRLGFKGGRVLEPSMGTGNFFGAMPKDMRSNSTLMGVEIDPLTSEIATQLYQKANIKNTGFEKITGMDDFFDLVISNVPFDNHQVKDKKYDRFHYLIHNYFFAKSMDMVRPGGLVCFITGQGTMKAGSDAALLRKMLATQADLITAIKLPDTAFEGANTSVTSDLIILRKRDNKMKDKNAGELWEDVESIPITTKNGTVNGEINTFYKKHKDNMIGKLDVDWRGNVVLHGKGYNIVDRMEKIINSLPENIYKEENAGKPQPSDSLVMKAGFTKSQKLEGALSLIDGNVYMMSDNVPVELKGAKKETAKAYIKVRNALRSLLEAEIKPNEQESVVEHLRKELNKAYDGFKKKYGNLNDNKNKKMFVSDPDAGMVLALEVEDENHKIVKAKIFEQRSVAPRANIEHVSTPKDALTASLTMKGRVDLDYMAKIYGKPKDEIVQMLDGVIFNDPKEGYVTAAEYLSGNVREKLEHAEEMAKTDASFKKNVEALKEVQPVDLIPEEIHATLGATWIPESDVQDFVDAILKEDLHSYKPDIKVHYDRNLHRWIVEGKGGNALNGQMTYATENRSFINILDYALNNSNSIIKAAKDSNGVITPEAAQKAADENKALQQKIADLKARFSMWIWEDKDRSTRLSNYYNRYFNNNVIQVYDGSHLTFDGMNKTIELRPHQKNVIWRTMQSANTLIAHCVGAGKTFEMIASAMEMKRIGLCKKPIFTVPRNVVSQFASDFQRLYPMAKVLIIDSTKLPAIPQKVNKIWLADYNKGVRGKEFNKHKRDPLYGGEGKRVDMVYQNPEAAQKSIAQRNKILAQIRYGDWDGIVIGHKPFANFALTPDTVEVFIDEELAPLRRALREAESSREPDKRLIKRLKEAIAKLEVRLERATDQDKKAVGMYFEDLGIDQLFVDEADMFKNLEMTTRLNRIAGVSAGGSERAFDMYMKTKYLTRLNNGRGVVFATGTPISNTLNELYNMERYLMGDILENEYDIHTFDEWVDAFGEVITRVERDPSGEGYRDVNRIKFANLPEVVKMIRRIMDVVTVDDLKASGKEIKLPKLKNGKKTVVAVEPSKAQDEYIHGNQPGGIKARVKWVRDNPKLAALGGEYDNMLRITNDLRKASLDMRLVKPSLPASTENGRARAVASEAYEKYKESNDIKGTQIIFCDMSTPKTGPAITTEDKELEKQDISMYEEIRDELVKLGVPKKEIAFIHDAKTEEQIEDLFDTFNRGDVRFLIGSTEKMGAGSNIQKRTVALHHVTCPWRPRDIEQREGRIIRQGNINDEVEIFEYVTKDTYDANMWEKIKIKANMISQAMTDDLSVRELDEFSEGAASAREVEAICDKNPYLAKKAAIEDELDKLKGAKRDFVNTKKKQLRILEEKPALMEAADKAASRAEKDVAEKKDVTGKNFSIKIGNKNYTDRKLANDAIVNALMEVVDGKTKTIAEIGGFRVNAFRVQGYTTSTGRNANSIALQVVRNGAYDVNMGVDGNYINAITRTIIYKPNSVATEQRALANAYQREIEGAKKRSEAVFPHEQELADLEAKLREVEKQVVEYSAKLKEEQEQQIVNEAEKEIVTDPETGEIIESKPKSTEKYESPNFNVSGLSASLTPEAQIKLDTSKGKKMLKTGIEKISKENGGTQFSLDFRFPSKPQLEKFLKQADEFLSKSFSVSLKKEPADPRTVEELKSDILEAVPNARNVVDTGNGITMTLPNGAKMKVEISKSLDDKVSEKDKQAARLAHGLGNEVSITVNGYTLTGAKQAFIELALNGEKGTAFHEIFHVAYEMALTDAEKRAINIAFGEQAKAKGMSVIEYAADKYRDWRTYTRRLPTGLRRAFEAIKGTIDSMRRALLGINDEYLTDEVERIFRDIESGAVWERDSENLAENSVDNLLQKIDNEEKRYYENVDYSHDDMQLAYDKVRKGIETVKERIKIAKTHSELDEIRAKVRYINHAITLYNQSVGLHRSIRDNIACDVRFALEVFENDREVKEARNRIDKETSPEYQRGRDFRNLQAARDGLQPTVGHRVREREFGNSGFRLTDNINNIGANKHFIESFEKFVEEHPEKYDKEFYSASEKHSDQSAFSNGENAPQSFLEKTFKSFAKNSNIKGDKIIVEQNDKDGEQEEINLKNYIFSSPSRIAEKVGAFKYFYTIGKRAMDVLTQKRSYYERKLNKAFDLVKNEEDYKTLNDILVDGDVQGKEWTKAELIADGVKENVAEAYIQIRKLMDKAYRDVNEARRRPKTHTINNASEKQIQDLRDNNFVDILNIKEDEDGHKKVTYKEYANWERTYTVTKATLRRYNDDDAIQVLNSKQEGDDTFTVTVRESIPPVNKLTGYIPHFFHNYMVRIVDKDGEYVDTIDSGRTEREAVQKAEAWLKENKLEDGQTIHISPKIADFTSLGMDEGQYAAVMGDKDYYRMMNNIAKQNDMTFQEAKEMLNGSVRQKNRHRFFGNLMKRKGVNGYEKNMGYILRHYFNSASRYYAMETEFKPKAINMYERLYGDFDKEAPNTTADYTRDYINDINGNPTTLEKAINNALNKSSIFRKFVASNFGDRAALQLASNISSATSSLCLGFLNVSSAMLNLTQLINTAAYLNDFEALGMELVKGYRRKVNLGDLRILHETNVLNDIGLDSGSGYDMNRMTAKNLLGKLNKGGMVLFKATEAYCRCATVLAAYKSARKKGKSHNEAIEYAKEINRKSNFDYGVADAPNVFRRGSILSQLLLQFKKYGIKELEVMGDMLPWNKATNSKQKAIFWGLMLLACGLLQWPGEDFLDNVFFDGKLKPKAKAWMMEAAGDSPMGKALVKAAMYGLAAPITGVDISSRAGLADVIPSRGRDLGGPSITRTVSLAADLFQGKWADALRDFSPGLYNQYAAWIAEHSTGTRGRVNNYYDSFYDKALRAMGFKSVDESIDSDIQRITSIRKKEATEEKQRAIDDYIEDPSTENYRRLVELGVKAKTVQEERKKKKMDRLERIQSGMSKNDKKGNSGLIKFAE